MSISRLHLGQNKGKFKRVVSLRTLILVRQWHIGHRIHSDFRLVIDAKSHQLLATTNTSFLIPEPTFRSIQSVFRLLFSNQHSLCFW